MGKLAVALLTELLVVIPIALGGRFHGHFSYRQYYDNHVNDGRMTNPTTATYETAKESYDEPEDTYASENSPGSSDLWQARSGGDNYVQVPRCTHMGQTFCEDVPDYPQDFVNRMIAKNSSLLSYAQEDVIGLAPRSDVEEEPLCLSTEKLITPKVGINMKNQWLYILQSNETNFRQSLRIETCREEDAKCRLIDGIAEGYVTTCKQKYIYRELAAISHGDIVHDYFRLPASCCCHVQFKADNKGVVSPNVA
ncbi:PREDICTED: uncharacterized protein LOC105570541 [Vollenhovia emeryi]|uniref:uncharacterized protein LOC105570541 n=1 Tax=Vollenhovia emeryi TaxID=411798 RepID=UPI0005F425BD|nr:PREDICTED: uncharacterized protein LOC105570541 [Vollenhovia emeryi]